MCRHQEFSRQFTDYYSTIARPREFKYQTERKSNSWKNKDHSCAGSMSMPVLNFASEKLSDVLTEVNQLNAGTTSVKLYVDTQKNVVMAEFFLLATEDSLIDISLTGTGVLIGFTDQVYEGMKDLVV